MTNTHGRHRKPSAARRHLGRAAIAGVALGAPMVLAAAPAQAATGNNWDAVAQCESSGNWSANTGNGFYGGLQFTMSTWKGYGGAGVPQAASKAEQIRVAENVLAGQGKGAWPVCGKNLGSGTSTSTSVQAAPAAEATPAKKSAPMPTTAASAQTGASYTVVSGDTLSKIAQAHGVQGGYTALFEKNTDVITDVNVIFPGETLHL